MTCPCRAKRAGATGAPRRSPGSASEAATYTTAAQTKLCDPIHAHDGECEIVRDRFVELSDADREAI